MRETNIDTGSNDVAGVIGATTAVAGAILGLVTTLKSFGTLPNIPCKTLGGKVFWNTLAEKNGLKVQKNMITGHCRVLDSSNRRLAWGFSEEALLSELQKLSSRRG